MSIERETYARCFSIIYRLGKMINDNAAKEFGLTGHELDYIIHVINCPGISQGDLAKHYRIDKGSVAKSVKRMIDKGYINRQASETDGRAYCLYPTDAALAISERGRGHGEDLETLITKGIGEDEQVILQDLLVKVTTNIAELWEGGK